MFACACDPGLEGRPTRRVRACVRADRSIDAGSASDLRLRDPASERERERERDTHLCEILELRSHVLGARDLLPELLHEVRRLLLRDRDLGVAPRRRPPRVAVLLQQVKHANFLVPSSHLLGGVASQLLARGRPVRPFPLRPARRDFDVVRHARPRRALLRPPTGGEIVVPHGARLSVCLELCEG